MSRAFLFDYFGILILSRVYKTHKIKDIFAAYIIYDGVIYMGI